MLLLIGLWTTVAHAAPLKPKNSKARKHFDAAVELYKNEDYDGAADQASRGLAIEEHESLLFILAQAQRQQGNCIEAVEVFTKFIETTSSDDMRQNALTAKALCAEELAEIARQAELAAQEAEAAAAAAAAALEADKASEPPPPPPPEAWYRDPVGGVLVGVGGAGVLAGGALLISAAVLAPGRATVYGTYAERSRQQPKLLVAGGITAGVGVLLAAGGAVRWVLVAKRNKATAPPVARLQLGPWLDRRRAGVSFRVRF